MISHSRNTPLSSILRSATLVPLAVAGLACHATTARSETALLPAPDPRYPSYILELPASISDVLIADTSTSTMWRFTNNGAELMPADERYVSVGRNGVGKERAWDRKTPLGVYFVTDVLDTSKMHEKYGVAAYPLDYPNAWDRYNERTGYGIWLHGVDRNNADRPPRDTDGCLALPNDALLSLSNLLQPGVTPVIVAREIRWKSKQSLESRRREFRRMLELWRESQQQNDLMTYLSLYHEDFRHLGLDKPGWSEFRMQVFESRRPLGIRLEDVLLVADPEVPELYISRFNQVLTTDYGPVITTKRLYWRREAGDRWRILSEDTG